MTKLCGSIFDFRHSQLCSRLALGAHISTFSPNNCPVLASQATDACSKINTGTWNLVSTNRKPHHWFIGCPPRSNFYISELGKGGVGERQRSSRPDCRADVLRMVGTGKGQLWPGREVSWPRRVLCAQSGCGSLEDLQSEWQPDEWLCLLADRGFLGKGPRHPVPAVPGLRQDGTGSQVEGSCLTRMITSMYSHASGQSGSSRTHVSLNMGFYII